MAPSVKNKRKLSKRKTVAFGASRYSRVPYYTQLGSCHGPAGGAPSAGVGGGVPAERIPRVTPPYLARRGEIANKFNKD
jgi:hypothetical protein